MQKVRGRSRRSSGLRALSRFSLSRAAASAGSGAPILVTAVSAPAMRTNTSRIMTSFSDLPHDAGSPTYPTNEAMGEYLQRYAEMFDLTRRYRIEDTGARALAVMGMAGSCAPTPARSGLMKVVVATRPLS